MPKDIEQLKELSLAEDFGRLYRIWRNVVDVELEPLKLTYPRWTALWKLLRLGDNVSQKVLANALEIELPSLMRTLGQLESQGLIERHACSKDKRARIVTLTPSGKALLKKIEARIIEVRIELLSGVSMNELFELERVMKIISDNANKKLAKLEISTTDFI